MEEQTQEERREKYLNLLTIQASIHTSIAVCEKALETVNAMLVEYET